MQVLAALANQRGVEFDGVLLDSGTRDGSLNAAPARMRVVPIGRTFTHPSSSNDAARLSTAPLIVFLSQDALPLHDDFLARLVDPFSDPRVAASFARQVPASATPALEARDLRRAYPETGDSPVVLSNAASALRRELWERHPFDERLPLAEDLEWGAWAIASGHTIRYVPGARVEHGHGYDEESLSQRYESEGRALRMLSRPVPGEGRAIRIWLRGLPGDLAAVARAGRWAEFPHAFGYHLNMFRSLERGARAADERGSR